MVTTMNVLYGERDANAQRGRVGDDVPTSADTISSSFTAINQRSTQTLPSQSPVQQNQARRRAPTADTRRRHNPAVAQYLGLGSEIEPEHIGRYAPLPAVPDSPSSKPVRKRRKRADKENTLSGTWASAGKSHVSNQPLVSESFRATKVVHKAATPSKTAASEASELDAQLSPTNNNDLSYSHEYRTDQVSRESPGDGSSAATAQNVSQETLAAQYTENSINLRLFDEAHEYDTHGPDQADHSISEDQEFDDDIDDDELLMLTPDIDATNNTSPPANPVSKDYREQYQDPCSERLVPHTSQRASKQFVSPITLTTRLLAVTGDAGSAPARKPITRPPFPDAVRDRSPIIGLSSSTLLRTCFRIGEAINQSCQASKSGRNIIIELYARVLASERTEKEQRFTFCDLFHAKPPHIKAVYSAAIWKSVELFEYDSRRLLKEGRMCRCIGSMKRDGKEWVMIVVNMWEATWEDIKWVEGIVSF